MRSRRRRRRFATSHAIPSRPEYLPYVSQDLHDGPFANLAVGGHLLPADVVMVALDKVAPIGIAHVIIQYVIRRVVVCGMLLEEGRGESKEGFFGGLVPIGTEAGIAIVVGVHRLVRGWLVRRRLLLKVRLHLWIRLARGPVGATAITGAAHQRFTTITERSGHGCYA